MQRIRITFATVAILLVCNACRAQLYPSPGINMYTNPVNPLDVDGNGLVQPRDVLLVINRLEAQADAKAAALNSAATITTLAAVPASPTYFWDTTSQGIPITPRDALVVINYLNSGVSIAPEPSSMAIAGLGLLALLGCAWRRTRRSTEIHQ